MRQRVGLEGGWGMFFTGKRWDEDAQLYYFNARWYDPETGRFITEDPVKDGLLWFAYVNNNPMGYIDPTGMRQVEGASTQEQKEIEETKSSSSTPQNSTPSTPSSSNPPTPSAPDIEEQIRKQEEFQNLFFQDPDSRRRGGAHLYLYSGETIETGKVSFREMAIAQALFLGENLDEIYLLEINTESQFRDNLNNFSDIGIDVLSISSHMSPFQINFDLAGSTRRTRDPYSFEPYRDEPLNISVKEVYLNGCQAGADPRNFADNELLNQTRSLAQHFTEQTGGLVHAANTTTWNAGNSVVRLNNRQISSLPPDISTRLGSDSTGDFQFLFRLTPSDGSDFQIYY